MQSSDYWEQRALQREAEAYKDTADVIRRLRALYTASGKRLSDAAKTIFANYLNVSGIDEREARKLLSIEETAKVLSKLREEYMQTGSADALARLNAPSYAYRINRVQALEKAIEAEAAALADLEPRIGEQHLIRAYDDGYYKTMYDAVVGHEGDVNFSTLPHDTIVEAVENRWAGKNYSQRVWKNTEVVAKEAGKIVDSGVTSGTGVYKMANELRDLLNVAAYASERLIRTETNRMHNDAAKTAYEAMGVKQYRYLATLDARTCVICGALDGKHFDVSDAETGVNFPPMHPNDRCTTVAYYPDDELDGVRTARNPVTGKNYKVPEGMTYAEWRKAIAEKYGSGTLEKAKKTLIAKRRSAHRKAV
ncbi:phage putative head morphogenesis protein, SPP1 gp7 family [Sporobacter termitidis DSM 10068]|uniref:Phage putative head morphogenesis protein, SPP1 gp7 family n=1 Tax=Sporobacter termitidis DSM 10068 TaxID=1123282 RepID=A0A1M5ZJT0_9FIRM|nr:minor capsid protein [Sporobacter termitidis]SHI24327.1 phage putative head morphogenesis protein, SPP1 gp7 family [Sporobacter termitidis DSM 10068]SHI24595.1 phage putative head morphogenesis protein, SPP1 gp7 family [Sporobacter termitidis DSM 10068]